MEDGFMLSGGVNSYQRPSTSTRLTTPLIRTSNPSFAPSTGPIQVRTPFSTSSHNLLNMDPIENLLNYGSAIRNSMSVRSSVSKPAGTSTMSGFNGINNNNKNISTFLPPSPPEDSGDDRPSESCNALPVTPSTPHARKKPPVNNSKSKTTMHHPFPFNNNPLPSGFNKMNVNHNLSSLSIGKEWGIDGRSSSKLKNVTTSKVNNVASSKVSVNNKMKKINPASSSTTTSTTRSRSTTVTATNNKQNKPSSSSALVVSSYGSIPGLIPPGLPQELILKLERLGLGSCPAIQYGYARSTSTSAMRKETLRKLKAANLILENELEKLEMMTMD